MTLTNRLRAEADALDESSLDHIHWGPRPPRPSTGRKDVTRLQQIILAAAKELLKRHPDRRGPYIITDAELKRYIRKAQAQEEKT